jgi:radical SAM protein with 4Fe4S-binding SPASM domain
VECPAQPPPAAALDGSGLRTATPLRAPDLTLGELCQEMLAELGGRRHPFSGTFEVTERCNLACVHCFISQPAGSQAARAQELTAAQIAGLLDQMTEAGCLYVLFTGGEVFLRPDFADIYRHAVRNGLLVSIFTNGTLLTPAIADTLAEWRPWSIEVSLYGGTPGTYERVTQVPGSHARCMSGLRLLLERGLRLSLKAVVLDANRGELEAMRACAAGLGLKFRYDALVWPRLDGGQAPCAHRLPAADVVALDRDDPDRRREWEAALRQSGGALLRAERVYGCGAGVHAFHVDSGGRLSMCMMARRPAYDLLEGSFQAGWDEFLGPLASRKRSLDTACRTCAVGALCTQCPGWSQAIHGDDETPVEFVCEIGRLRAAELAGAGLLLEGAGLQPVPLH